MAGFACEVLVDETNTSEKRVRQSRLAVVDVSNHRDVSDRVRLLQVFADLFRVVFLHYCENETSINKRVK